MRHQTPAITFSHMCIYILRTLKNKNYQNKRTTSDAMLCSVGDGASWECGLNLVSHLYFSLIYLGWGHFSLEKNHLGSPSAFPFNNWKPLFIIYVKIFFSSLLFLTFPLIRILGIPWLSSKGFYACFIPDVGHRQCWGCVCVCVCVFFPLCMCVLLFEGCSFASAQICHLRGRKSYKEEQLLQLSNFLVTPKS